MSENSEQSRAELQCFIKRTQFHDFHVMQWNTLYSKEYQKQPRGSSPTKIRDNEVENINLLFIGRGTNGN